MLFIFAGVFYISKYVVKEDISSESKPVTETVPATFAPIKTYTENCILSVGKKGLIILGQQGGYIYPDVLGDFSITKPTESIGLNLQPTKIPYWHYNSQPNSGSKVSYSSLKPELYEKNDPSLSVESQLKKYVLDKLDSCLENYTVFNQQGFNISQEAKTVTVRVQNKTVDFSVKLPLTVAKGNAETQMNYFYVQVPLNLVHYYEVAERITAAETNYTFMERHAMNLISSFSGLDMTKLPPTSATTFELAPTLYWNEKQVEKDVKKILNSYVPMLRYLGSNNFYDYIFPETKLSNFYQGVYDQMVLTLKGADDLNVDFHYFNWPIYLKTNSDEGIIRPFHFFVNYQLLKIGHQSYQTNYDVSYPVLVTLRDESAFKGEGYDFVFALEGNVRNNKPANQTEAALSFTPMATQLACKKELWDTGSLKTVIIDGFTKQPVDKVKVDFSLPHQDSCEVGFTDTKGVVESKYPAAYGGVLSFVKTGYLTDFYPIDTYAYKGKSGLIGYAAKDQPANKYVEIYPFKKINVSIKKKNLEKCLTPLTCQYTEASSELLGGIPFKDISCEKSATQCFFNNGNTLFNSASDKPVFSVEANSSVSRYHDYYFKNAVKPLDQNESTVLVFRRVYGPNLENTGSEFTVSVNVFGNESQQIELVPGIYELSATLYSDEPLNIQKEQRCISFDILTWSTEECFNMNGSKLDKHVEGMIEWNTAPTYFKITADGLYTSNNLEIYLLAQDLAAVPEKVKATTKKCSGFLCLPSVGCAFEGCKEENILINGRVTEDLQLLGSMGNISRQSNIRNTLEPKFS